MTLGTNCQVPGTNVVSHDAYKVSASIKVMKNAWNRNYTPSIRFHSVAALHVSSYIEKYIDYRYTNICELYKCTPANINIKLILMKAIHLHAYKGRGSKTPYILNAFLTRLKITKIT